MSHHIRATVAPDGLLARRDSREINGRRVELLERLNGGRHRARAVRQPLPSHIFECSVCTALFVPHRWCLRLKFLLQSIRVGASGHVTLSLYGGLQGVAVARSFGVHSLRPLPIRMGR
jgi:hypothetical protein